MWPADDTWPGYTRPFHFLGKSPRERLRNRIRHFIFVSFLYFFYHSSCRKDQFTLLNQLKFCIEDFTDPGPLNWSGWPSMVCRCGFCLHKCFWEMIPTDVLEWQKRPRGIPRPLEFFLGDSPWFWAKEDEWPLLFGQLILSRSTLKYWNFVFVSSVLVRRDQEIIFDDVLKWWKGLKDQL